MSDGDGDGATSRRQLTTVKPSWRSAEHTDLWTSWNAVKTTAWIGSAAARMSPRHFCSACILLAVPESSWRRLDASMAICGADAPRAVKPRTLENSMSALRYAARSMLERLTETVRADWVGSDSAVSPPMRMALVWRIMIRWIAATRASARASVG